MVNDNRVEIFLIEKMRKSKTIKCCSIFFWNGMLLIKEIYLWVWKLSIEVDLRLFCLFLFDGIVMWDLI